MKTVFWLLDINYKVEKQKAEIWLWGIDDKGKRILIIDRGFRTYFYLVAEEGQNPQSIIKVLESRKTSDFPSVAQLEFFEKKYFGKSINAVKVYCQDPDAMAKYAKAMTKIEGVKESLEDDIRYSMRYLIDNGISPCCWHEIDLEQIENTYGVQADQVYKAKSIPKRIDKPELPQLRVLGFSKIAYSQKGEPKPEKNPVIIVSLTTNTGKMAQFTAKSYDDKLLLEEFVKYVGDFDPDIVVGYGTNRQDWLYLTARAKKLGVRFFVDRAHTEPHMSVYGHI